MPVHPARNEKCATCRYWSELMAMSVQGCDVQAMCLNASSPQMQRYTLGDFSCDKWASGHHGSVDDPEIGDQAIESYERETPHEPPPS